MTPFILLATPMPPLRPSAPPVSDGTLQAKATSLLTDYGTWLKTKDPALEKQIKRKRNDLILQLDKDADYLQGVARDVAVAAGDVTAGEAVVIRIGFTLKKKSPSHPRDFEFLKAEKGSFHVRVKSASKGRSTYVYEYGITTDEDVMPAKWEKPVSLPVTELIVSGLKAGTIIGVRYTVVLPPSHTKKTAAKMSATTDKNATILTTNKAKKVTVTHGTELYNFSEILYIAIQ
ncbi:MAG: hypothetical protein HY063_00075 [Bacteroidetes bacterium]|nr:hypothetical protein [Bacteroidota bacterium]